jgi:hypothetical protein
MKSGSGNHYYFCHFVDAASLPREPLTSETSPFKENVEVELVWVGFGAGNADF